MPDTKEVVEPAAQGIVVDGTVAEELGSGTVAI